MEPEGKFLKWYFIAMGVVLGLMLVKETIIEIVKACK